MLGDLIKILREYSVKNLAHGDIQPHNIFIINEDCETPKKMKIIDTCFINEFESGYERMKVDSEYQTPLSPQALFCLSNRDANPNYNKSKNDIWAAGVTM